MIGNNTKGQAQKNGIKPEARGIKWEEIKQLTQDRNKCKIK